MPKPGKAKRPSSHGDGRRCRDFKYLYGITLVDFNKMLEDQQGRCAICHRLPEEAKEKMLFVDHCHGSDKVRGLLCRYCNTGLGQFQDNIQRLKTAIKYLTKAFKSTIVSRRGKGR